jgi:hypothetical protein
MFLRYLVPVALAAFLVQARPIDESHSYHAIKVSDFMGVHVTVLSVVTARTTGCQGGQSEDAPQCP